MSEPIKIKYSKQMAYFSIIIMLLLIILITYTILNTNFKNWRPYSLYYIESIDLLCFGITINLIANYLIPSIKESIALTIDKENIIDNIRNVTVKWDNVRAIRLVQTRGDLQIAIDLNNPKEITNQTNNIFKKVRYAYNNLFYKTPILVSVQYIEISINELFNSISYYFDER